MPIEEASWDEIDTGEDTKVTVSSTGFKEVLSRLDLQIGDSGYIKDASGELVKANDELEITFDSLGAIGAGSKVFIRDSLASFSDYLAHKK